MKKEWNLLHFSSESGMCAYRADGQMGRCREQKRLVDIRLLCISSLGLSVKL